MQNVRKNTYHFKGRTGAPTYSDVTDGKAIVRIPYDGEYERVSIQWNLIPIRETKSARGVIAVTVVATDAGVRATEIDQVETDGLVTDRGHNAQKCAKAAVSNLVNQEQADAR
jgi:hypothetical protein